MIVFPNCSYEDPQKVAGIEIIHYCSARQNHGYNLRADNVAKKIKTPTDRCKIVILIITFIKKRFNKSLIYITIGIFALNKSIVFKRRFSRNFCLSTAASNASSRSKSWLFHKLISRVHCFSMCTIFPQLSHINSNILSNNLSQ